MRKILWVLLVASLLCATPHPVLPQANTTTANPPRTYSAGFSVSCAGAGDCVTVTLAAAGMTTIRELWLTSSAAATVSLVRRTTLDTGGTHSVVTLVKSDTNDATPNTIVTAYTAVPTPGASAGTAFSLALPIDGTVIKDATISNYKPFVMQSSTEVYAIVVDGATTLSVNLVVTEL